ncbi:MAG: class I SAM-dependent methyltransferase [Bryobacteraceae bacterium]
MIRFAALAAVTLVAQQTATQRAAKDVKLGPYYPTPEKVVVEMLRVGELKAGEKMFDLGSGDGRVVVAAAKLFQAVAAGVELDEGLVRKSSEWLRREKLRNARIIHGDALLQDYSSADLVTVYLLPEANEKLTPILEKQLRAGARVVSHDFEFRRWKPAKIVTLEDGPEGWPHTIYLYRR